MPEIPQPLPESEITELPMETLNNLRAVMARDGIPYLELSHDRPITTTADKITALETRALELEILLLNAGIQPFYMERGYAFTATRTNTATIIYQGDKFPFLVTTTGTDPLSPVEKRMLAYSVLEHSGKVPKNQLIVLGDNLGEEWETTDWISNKALKEGFRIGQQSGIDLAELQMGEGFVGPFLPTNSQMPNLILQRRRIFDNTAQRTPLQMIDIATSQQRSILIDSHHLLSTLDIYSRQNGNNLLILNSPHNMERYRV